MTDPMMNLRASSKGAAGSPHHFCRRARAPTRRHRAARAPKTGYGGETSIARLPAPPPKASIRRERHAVLTFKLYEKDPKLSRND